MKVSKIKTLNLLCTNAFIFILVISISGCGPLNVYVTPAGKMPIKSEHENKKPIPIFKLGEKNAPVEKMAAQILIVSGAVGTNIPIDFNGELPEYSVERLIKTANELGMDEVVSVTYGGYIGWNIGGMHLTGIGIKHKPTTSIKQQNRKEFIACILPMISNTEKNEAAIVTDNDIRAAARFILEKKGYYVLTPKHIEDNDLKLTRLQSMSSMEIDNICKHPVDFLIRINSINNADNENALSLSTYSKSQNKIIFGDNINHIITDEFLNNAPFLSPIGLMIFSDLIADQSQIEKLLKVFPNIGTLY